MSAAGSGIAVPATATDTVTGVVTIVGAAAIAPARTASPALTASHPEVVAAEVPASVLDGDGALPRARKMMSRGATLAALALGRVLEAAGWTGHCDDVGYYLGVGASAGSMDDLRAMLRESIAARSFSLEAFGDRGVAACNPLLAFQLMNNFTLAHGAIQHGVRGPNSAFFSRGAGTTFALMEAAAAIRDGDCARAVAGGADSALHPVTWAELARGGFAAAGLVPAEGAALLALARAGEAPALGRLESCAVHPARSRPLAAVAAAAVEAATAAGDIDLVCLAPWGDPARAALAASVPAGAAVVDASAAIGGDALAATPALAWVEAANRIGAGEARRALVLSAGTDGDLGTAVIAAAAPGDRT